MNILVAVDDPRDWSLDIPGVVVVSGRDYLTDPRFGEGMATVFNLCRSYQYQSLGYYVSLLAEARGHRPLPRLNTVGDLQSPGMVCLLTEKLDDLSRRSPAASDLPPHHQAFVARGATEYLVGRRDKALRRAAPAYDVAILHDPQDPEPPSNAEAMRKFVAAADGLGMRAEFITRADMGRLTAFDALFIRDTTNVNHYTYRFSCRAAAEGLVVIDDPDSIIKCTNKVYLAELFARHHIPAPRTLTVHRHNIGQIMPALGLPCVLKQPDSSGSLGVLKVHTEAQLHKVVDDLLGRSELIVAQEFLPTTFDWRVGVLDRQPLFVCKYNMAPDHWQIIKRERGHKLCEGPTEVVPLSDAPKQVVALGVRAANLIGDGLYGVDIKQRDGRCYVMEINDNPNLDAGNEDQLLHDELYRVVMAVFARRVEARKRDLPR
jgi:glutathione synthase/RimK-type ligase-like ATP-grasp enzyme